MAIVCWACIIGAFLYLWIMIFPTLLSHLPESSILVNGPYSINDQIFWQAIHPITVFFSMLALIFNWENKDRRKLISVAIGIYILILIATFIFFVLELMEFYHSNQNTLITASERYHRGQVWSRLNVVRGLFMSFGFLLLLIALTKDHTNHDNQLESGSQL